MPRIVKTLVLSLLLVVGCVKDQQAARTRNSGVDKEPEKHETATPEKLPPEKPPSEPSSEELPPIEQPK